MLEIRDLHVRYGQAKALKGVSLTVGKGEIVALIGNNGAGKTTLLNTVTGLIRPVSGEIEFEGKQITRSPSDTIVKLGIAQVPEGRQIFPDLTVMENLRLGAFTRKGDLSADYDRVFTLFPILKERARQPGGTLSGGEQQMLALGRAIMTRPKLFLLDEPSLGLAPVVVERIYETIGEIHREGATMLIIEQNAFVALTTAARAYVMETGRIVLAGESSQMIENPQVRKAYLGS